MENDLNLKIVRSLQEKRQELIFQKEEIDKKINSLDFTLSLYNISSQKLQESSLESSYNKSATWKEKILWAVKELKEAYTNEITDLLKNKPHDIVLNDDKLIKRVTITVSNLYKEGELDVVETRGRANKYKLKSPN